MSSAARNYTRATIRKLFASSGNQCAFPDCTQNIVDKEGNMIGEICHIEAAEQGGLRYNPAQTDNPDNIDKYTVNVLKEMKENHGDNYIYKPYEVSQTVIEKILNMTQQSTEHNYSVTTINKNLGNGTQVTNNAEKSEGNTLIGNKIENQTNNYNSYPDTSVQDKSCQDREIIDEISHYILENKPSAATEPNRMKTSGKFIELKKKLS